MPNWQRQIKDYLAFSKKERKGIFVLLSLLVVLLLINMLLPFFFKNRPVDFSSFEKQFAEYETQLKYTTTDDSQFDKAGPSDNQNSLNNLKPFTFDPNSLPAEKWKEIGLSDQQIKVILNYRDKGGKFREKKDFAKIYSISEEEFKVLEPYIVIQSDGEEKKGISHDLKLNPFPFDPNKLTYEEGMKMGLHESVINAIINFRQKGGRFTSDNDFKKIYTLSEAEFEMLKPYIQISKDTSVIKIPKTNVMVELNSADSLDLQQLTGIGPSFSKRIIKYRDLLGGFHSKEQLREVYGMDSTRYNGIREYITVDPGQVKKININTVSIKEFTKHPYIEFYVAKSIINYRSTIGAYTDLNQIRDAKLIYTELFIKLEPYLSVK